MVSVCGLSWYFLSDMQADKDDDFARRISFFGRCLRDSLFEVTSFDICVDTFKTLHKLYNS